MSSKSINLSVSDIEVLQEAVAFTVSYISSVNDSESINAARGFFHLIKKVSERKSLFTIGEIANMCIALDVFIKESNQPSEMQSQLFKRLSVSLPSSYIQW